MSNVVLPAVSLAALSDLPVGTGGTLLAVVATLVLFGALRGRPPGATALSGQPAPLANPFTAALARTTAAFRDRLDGLFGGRPIDDGTLDELESLLLGADVGVTTTQRILDRIREVARTDPTPSALRAALREEMRKILATGDPSLHRPASGPWVILVVGVNGSGKTTTIGKLAARFGQQGLRVLMAAADTFRAAAIEQLTVWSERASCEIVAQQEGSDPGAVVYDALSKAVANGHDVVIIDTAGRLQTKKPLMDQLSKIRRVIEKVVPGAPHETLLVLDGTIGQNALSQAKLFHEATPLTGVVVTKLDGTAKGGMVLTLAQELSLPVKLVGLGEKVEDLRDFDAPSFIEALA